MRFSIIIPVYNVEEYLRDCIESIIQQDYKDFEIILVDDGSKDDSASICDAYKEKYNNIRVLHKRNQGSISARRAGYEISEGDYIINCDSDDRLEEGALERLSKIIEFRNPDMIIYNAYRDFGNRKKVFFENVFEQGFIKDKQQIYDKLLLSYQINSLCIKTYKRTLLDIDTDYSTFWDISYGEDLLQSIPIIIRAETIYYLNEKLYDYRMNSGKTAKYNNKQYWSYKRVYNEICKIMIDLNIRDFEDKTAKYLVSAAYDSIHLDKVVGEYHKDDIMNIVNDEAFIEAYRRVKSTKYIVLFTLKQRIVLKIIEYKWYNMLKALFQMSVSMNFLKRKA